MSQSKEYKVEKCDCCLANKDVSDRLKDINREYYKDSPVLIISMAEVDKAGIDVNEFTKRLAEKVRKNLDERR